VIETIPNSLKDTTAQKWAAWFQPSGHPRGPYNPAVIRREACNKCSFAVYFITSDSSVTQLFWFPVVDRLVQRAVVCKGRVFDRVVDDESGIREACGHRR